MFNPFRKTTEEEQLLLARRSLCSLAPEDDGFAGYDEMQFRKVCVDAKRLLEFQTLTAVIDDLKARQRNLIALNATRENLGFAQGVLNGLNLVGERLRVLAEKAKVKEEEFDKFGAI